MEPTGGSSCGNPAGRFAQSPNGTIVNVPEVVMTSNAAPMGRVGKPYLRAPASAASEKDVTWDTAFAVYGKVKKVGK